MATPESRLPVDTSVQLPASVRHAAAVAEAAHKATYPGATPDAPAPDATPADPTPPAPTAEATPPAAPVEPTPPPPEPTPAAPAPEPTPVGTAEAEHHRYLSMKGRYEQSTQTIGTLQEQMREMGDELMRMQQALQTRQLPMEQPEPQQRQPRKLVTEADVNTYGPELIDVIQRAAREALAPDLQVQRREIVQTKQRVAATTVHSALSAALPNWEEINNSPRFAAWCSKPDIYSGQLRTQMLRQAFQAADAPRVVAFFRGFLTEEAATGHVPSVPASSEQPLQAPRVAAVPLESLAAPGRARPASDNTSSVPADKPVFSRAQVAAFYDAVRKGHYSGREADKQRDELAINLAGKEGRIR